MRTTRFLSRFALLLVGCCTGGTLQAQTTYTWNQTSGGDWGTASNWSPSSNFPGNTSGTFDTATFGGDPLGGYAINISTGTISSGTVYLNALNFTQTDTTTGNSYTISGGTINLGGTTPTINVATSGVTASINSILGGGAVTLNKTGAGTLVLSGANTFTGATTISSGIVNYQNGTAFGGSSAITVASGASVQVQGGITGGSSALKISGAGAANATGALENVSGANSYAGLLTLGAASTISSDAGFLSLTNTGTITGAAFTLTLTGAGNGSIAGIIGTTSGGLTKSGSGTWSLAGANTYTGATTVSSGILNITGSTSSSSAVAVSAGGALGGTGTVNGAVTVAAGGGINLAADGVIGTLSLNSNLTFNGTVASPSNLYFNLGTTTTDQIAATGNVTVTTSAGASINFTQLTGGSINPGTYTLISGGSASSASTSYVLATSAAYGNTFTLSSTGTAPVLLQVTVAPAASGPAAAFWSGAANATWATAANWNTDAVSNVAAANFPGVGSNVTFYTTTPTALNLSTTLGADFEINSLTFSTSATSAVTIAGTNTLTIDATAANGNTVGNGINVQAGSHTISSKVGLGSSQTWTVGPTTGTSTASLTVNGVINDFGNGFSLTKTGVGTLTLSGSNTYSGGTYINQGTVIASGATNTNSTVFGSGTITLAGGSLYTASGVLTFANPVFVAPGTTTNVYGFGGGASYPKFAGALTGSGIFLNDNITGGLGNTFINGNISGFTGTISFVAVAGKGDNFQFAGTAAGGNFNGSGAHFVLSGPTSGAGAFIPIATVGEVFQMGDLSGTGGLIALNTAGTLQIGALNTNTTFAGVINNGNTPAVSKVGTGTLTFTGANLYAGGTTIQNGILQLGTLSGATVGSLAATGSITLGTGTTSGIFMLGDASNPVNQTISSLVISGTGAANAVVGGNAAVSTLTLNNSTADIYAGILGGNGTNQNNLALQMSGTGTLTLSGSHNTFTGGVTVTAGTLIAQSGSIGTGSPVTVSGGTLQAQSGSIASSSSVLISGGTLQAQSGSIGAGSTVTVSGGTLLALPGSVGANSILVGNSGTLQIQAGSLGAGTALTVKDPAILSVIGVTPTSTTSSMGSLTLGTSVGTTINFLLNGSPTIAPLTVTASNGLVSIGTTTLNITDLQTLTVGDYPLIAYSGTTLSTGFTIGSLRATANLDYSMAGLIRLNVTSPGGSIKWTGAVNTTWDVGTLPGVGGTNNWFFNGSATNFIPNDFVMFDDTASGTGPVSVSLGTTVNPGSVTFSNTNRAYSVSGTGNITGSTSVTINGGGTVSFSAPSTYTGGTFLTSGQLNINANGTATAGPIGTGLLTIAAGTTIDNTSAAAVTLATNNAQTWSGSFTFGGTNSLSLGTGAVAMGSSLTVTTNNAANGLTVGGVISDGGLGYGITKSGLGSLTLSGNNTYTGAVTLSQGTLVVNSNSTSDATGYTIGDSNTGSNNLILKLGAGFSTTNSTTALVGTRNINVTVSSLGTGAATIDVSAAGTNPNLTLVIDRATIIKGPKNQLLATISGPGAGAGNTSLTFDVNGGSFVWTSSGVANTFLGNVHFINSSTTAGTLQMQNIAYVANTAANQNLQIPDTSSLTIDPNITWAIVHGVETIDALNGSGTIRNNSGTNYLANTATLTVGAGNGSGNSSAVMVNNGGLAFSFAKAGTGTQVLTGVSTYTGGTTVQNGILQLGTLTGTTVGQLASTGAITLGSGTTSGILMLGDASNPVNQTIASLVTSGSGTANAVVGGNAAVSILTINNTAASTYAGNLGGSGTNQNNLGLTIANTGTLTLTGTSTYTGPTAIQAGTLQIGTAASLSSASTIVLGNGTASGTLDLNGLTVAVGGLAISGNGTANIIGNSSTTNSTLIYAGGSSNFGGIIQDYTTTPGSQKVLLQVNSGSLTLSGANTFTGGITVAAGGTLRLQSNSVVSTATIQVNDALTSPATPAGILSVYGVTPTSNTLTVSTLTLGNSTGGTVGFELGGIPSSAPLTISTGLTLNGIATLNVSDSQPITSFPVEIPLISYPGTPITSGFRIGTLPTARTFATIDYSTPGLIQLKVTGADFIRWTGAVNTTWDVGTSINVGGTLNWKANSTSSATNFLNGDSVVFDDSASTGGGAGPVAVALGVTVSPSSVLFSNATRPYTISGAGSIAGATGITVSGGATVTLATANSYTGTTTLSAGQLNMNVGGTTSSAIGRGTLIIATGTTISNTSGAAVSLGTNNPQMWNGSFTFGGNNPLNLGTGTVTLGTSLTVTANGTTNPLTVGGAIGDGNNGYSLTFPGPGIVALGGASSYSGGTTLSGGQLNINASGSGGTTSAIGTGLLTIATGTTIDNTSGTSVTLSTNNAQTWNSRFTFGGSNSLNLGTGAVTMNSSVTIVTNGTTNALTVGGPISDQGNGFSLTKSGTGTLVLGGANSFSGSTTISQGTLVANNSTALGSTSVTLGDANTGANPVVLQFGIGLAATANVGSISNSNFGTSQTIVLNSGSALGGNASVVTTILNLVGSVPVTIQAMNTGGHSTAQDTVYQITGNGIAPGSTALILDGTLAALRTSFPNGSAANNFTGDVIIKGTVNTQNLTYNGAIASNQNLGFLNNNVTVSAGATWTIVWGGETVGALNGSGNIVFNNQNALNNIGLTVGNTNVNGSYSGVISGSFGLGIVGTAAQALSGASTYSGGTVLNSGQLNINNGSAGTTTTSAIGTGRLTIAGGAIDNTSGAAITLGTNNAQSWTGDFTFIGSNPLNLGTGAVTLGGSRVVTVNGSALTVGGAISDGGNAYSLTTAGSGTLILTGSSTYTGGTFINSGTLQIGNGGTTGSLIGAVTVGTTLAFNLSVSSTFAPPGGISGSGTITQMGPGSVTLSGPNTFSGNVAVSAGTLRLQTGSVASTSTVTVSDAAALSVFGITPTSSTFSISSLTLGTSAGAILGFEFNGSPTTAPLTIGTSNGLTLHGTATINVSNLLSQTLGNIPLISYSGNAISSGFQIGSLPTARTLAHLVYTPGLIQLDITGSDSIKWTGANSNIWNAGTAVNVGGAFNWKTSSTSSSTNFVTGDSAIFDDSATGTGLVAINVAVNVAPSLTTFANSTRAYTLGGPGSIVGATSVIINGGGNVSLGTLNTYTGGTVLTSGQLNINASGTTTSSPIGTGALTIAAGATIDNTSGASVVLTTNNPQNWNGSFAFGGSNPLNLGTGAVTLGSSLTVTTTGGASSLTVGGVISDGTQGYGLTKSGAGSLILSNNNTFGGPVTISQGTLMVSGNSTSDATGYILGDSHTGSNNVLLQLGSGFNSNNNSTAAGITSRNINVTVNNLGTGSSTIDVSGAGTGPNLTLTINSAVTIKGPYNQMVETISGPGAGAGNTSLTIDVNGGHFVWTSSGVASTFTGNVHIINSSATAGNLQIQNLAYLGNIASNQNLVFPDTASVTLDSNIIWYIVHGVETIDGLNGSGTIQNNGGTSYLPGTATLTIGASNGSGNFSGLIQDNGTAFSLAKTGSGTQILSGASTYSGGTDLFGGTLSVSADTNLGATSGALVFLGGTLQVTGMSFTSTPRNIVWLPGGGGFDINNAANTFTVSQSLIDPGAPAPLTKLGSGTLVLTGTNTYTGGTTVLAGTLSVNDDAALGTPTGAVNIDIFGKVTFSAPTTTGRAFGPVGTSPIGGTLDSNTQIVTLNGATIGSVFLTGPGQSFSGSGINAGIPQPVGTGGFSTSGAGAIFNGTITQPNAVIYSNTTSDTFTNLNHGGYLAVAAGQGPFSLSTLGANFTNLKVQGSGAIVVGAGSTITVNGLSTNGFMELLPDLTGTYKNSPNFLGGVGGTLVNTAAAGAGELEFKAGSVTRIGTPSDDVNQTANVDLHGNNLRVIGGLFVNNGFIADYSGAGNGPNSITTPGAGPGFVIADSDSIVKGGGTYFKSPQTANTLGAPHKPGLVLPGNSIGKVTYVNATFGPGGVSNMAFQISDVNGPSGGAPSGSATGTPTSGYGLFNVSNTLTWTATSTNKVTVQLQSLLNNDLVGGPDNAGPVHNFNNTQSYTWPLIKWTTGYLSSNPQTSQALNATVNIDSTTAFSNVNPLNGGTFSVSLTGNTVGTGPGEIDIVFTPAATPEPATVLGLAAAGLGLFRVARRRSGVGRRSAASTKAD